MPNPTIELSKAQVIDVLNQFSLTELKTLMEELFRRKSFNPPSLKELEEETSGIIKSENLDIGIVEEAKRWGRSKRSDIVVRQSDMAYLVDNLSCLNPIFNYFLGDSSIKSISYAFDVFSWKSNYYAKPHRIRPKPLF